RRRSRLRAGERPSTPRRAPAPPRACRCRTRALPSGRAYQMRATPTGRKFSRTSRTRLPGMLRRVPDACHTHFGMQGIDQLVARSKARRRLPAPGILRLIRERAQLSQADIAEPVGVDRATVARWEL